MTQTEPNIHRTINTLYQQESRRIYATLVRLLGDLELAEEALHHAFVSALSQWPEQGLPNNPRAWLVSTGRFKAIDQIRRNEHFRQVLPHTDWLHNEASAHHPDWDGDILEDDQLRLIFTCCHPAIAPKVQVPLTLREVCGLTTEEIANGFLVSPTTMAQRIVRGKAKIREANIPFEIPEQSELPERLETVLSVIYLVFNEGYSASRGDALIRHDLSREAIRLARLIRTLLPDAEVAGLLALMLLQESRREARMDAQGDIILLEAQDRTRWDQALIQEGQALIQTAMTSRNFGSFTLQAAIAAVHAEAKTSADTDWQQITALYTLLLQLSPSPVIELNRAVAIAMSDGPQAGLSIIDRILQRGELNQYHLAHAARGELLRRTGDLQSAKAAFEQALSLTQQIPEQRLLKQRIQQLQMK